MDSLQLHFTEGEAEAQGGKALPRPRVGLCWKQGSGLSFYSVLLLLLSGEGHQRSLVTGTEVGS